MFCCALAVAVVVGFTASTFSTLFSAPPNIDILLNSSSPLQFASGVAGGPTPTVIEVVSKTVTTPAPADEVAREILNELLSFLLSLVSSIWNEHFWLLLFGLVFGFLLVASAVLLVVVLSFRFFRLLWALSAVPGLLLSIEARLERLERLAEAASKSSIPHQNFTENSPVLQQPLSPTSPVSHQDLTSILSVEFGDLAKKLEYIENFIKNLDLKQHRRFGRSRSAPPAVSSGSPRSASPPGSVRSASPPPAAELSSAEPSSSVEQSSPEPSSSVEQSSPEPSSSVEQSSPEPSSSVEQSSPEPSSVEPCAVPPPVASRPVCPVISVPVDLPPVSAPLDSPVVSVPVAPPSAARRPPIPNDIINPPFVPAETSNAQWCRKIHVNYHIWFVAPRMHELEAEGKEDMIHMLRAQMQALYDWTCHEYRKTPAAIRRIFQQHLRQHYAAWENEETAAQWALPPRRPEVETMLK